MKSMLSKGENCILVGILLIAVCASFLWREHHVSAADYTSSHFIVRDPVITVGGGYGSSSNFQYFASLGQTVIGQSTSATFIDRSGFLYF